MSTNSVTRSLVLSVIAAFALTMFAAATAQQTDPATTAAGETDDADFSPPQIVLGSQKQPCSTVRQQGGQQLCVGEDRLDF